MVYDLDLHYSITLPYKVAQKLVVLGCNKQNLFHSPGQHLVIGN